MTNFTDKERAQENKFALDQEKEFKIIARRNKLFGLWAAGLMGYDADKATAYAKEVVLADFEEMGDDDVFRKVQNDLKTAGKTVNEDELKRKMSELLSEAKQQLEAEGK